MSVSHLNIWVITLENALERQQRIERIFQHHNLDFNFLYGVDGRLGEHELLKKFNPHAFLRKHGRYSVAGEAGCYASHYLAWQKAVELDEPVIVLEDDCVLSDDASEAFQQAHRLVCEQGFGFIRLERDKVKKPAKLVCEESGFEVFRFYKIPQSTTGYIISPEVAKAFIAASERFVLPVDYFIRHMYLHKQPIYVLRPSPVWADDANIATIMDNRRARKAPLIFKFTRHAFRMKSMLLNGIWNIRFLLRDIQRDKV